VLKRKELFGGRQGSGSKSSTTVGLRPEDSPKKFKCVEG